MPKGNRIEIPESLKDVVLADISIEDIENGWTEFSAVCDAVAAGRISAVLACERFGSASRGEQAYKAGHAYGLLLRTLARRTESKGLPSLWPVTPSVTSEHSAELIGCPISRSSLLIASLLN